MKDACGADSTGFGGGNSDVQIDCCLQDRLAFEVAAASPDGRIAVEAAASLLRAHATRPLRAADTAAVQLAHYGRWVCGDVMAEISSYFTITAISITSFHHFLGYSSCIKICRLLIIITCV